jgi:hypothetical protein
MADHVKQVWRSLLTFEQGGRQAWDLLSLAGRPPRARDHRTFDWRDAAFILVAVSWLAALAGFLIDSFP